LRFERRNMKSNDKNENEEIMILNFWRTIKGYM
jgi:hypothetical protein